MTILALLSCLDGSLLEFALLGWVLFVGVVAVERRTS